MLQQFDLPSALPIDAVLVIWGAWSCTTTRCAPSARRVETFEAILNGPGGGRTQFFDGVRPIAADRAPGNSGSV